MVGENWTPGFFSPRRKIWEGRVGDISGRFDDRETVRWTAVVGVIVSDGFVKFFREFKVSEKALSMNWQINKRKTYIYVTDSDISIIR